MVELDFLRRDSAGAELRVYLGEPDLRVRGPKGREFDADGGGEGSWRAGGSGGGLIVGHVRVTHVAVTKCS